MVEEKRILVVSGIANTKTRINHVKKSLERENIIMDSNINGPLKFKQNNSSEGSNYNVAFIEGHGDIEFKEGYQSHKILIGKKKVSCDFIKNIQKKTGVTNFVFAACYAGQLMKDLESKYSEFKGGTKIIITASSKYESEWYENIDLFKNINDLYSKGNTLDEIFFLLSNKTGQTIQYGEIYNKVDTKERCFLKAKLNSRPNIEGIPENNSFSYECLGEDSEIKESLKSKMLELYKKNKTFEMTQEFIFSSLVQAVQRGKTDRIDYYLAKYNGNINDAHPITGSTLLHYACHFSNSKTVGHLLDNGADINCKNKLGRTPLLYSVVYNKLETTEFLLQKQADVDCRNIKGKTALYYAFENKNPKMINLLIRSGADVNIELQGGFTPLLHAIQKEDIGMVERLLESNYDINIGVQGFDNALDFALLGVCNEQIVKMIVDKIEKSPSLYNKEDFSIDSAKEFIEHMEKATKATKKETPLSKLDETNSSALSEQERGV